jgi:hypothetical protein
VSAIEMCISRQSNLAVQGTAGGEICISTIACEQTRTRSHEREHRLHRRLRLQQLGALGRQGPTLRPGRPPTGQERWEGEYRVGLCPAPYLGTRGPHVTRTLMCYKYIIYTIWSVCNQSGLMMVTERLHDVTANRETDQLHRSWSCRLHKRLRPNQLQKCGYAFCRLR